MRAGHRTGAGTALSVALFVLCVAAPGAAAAPRGSADSVAGSAKNMLLEVSPYPADLRLAAHGFDAELPGVTGLFAATDVQGYAVGSGELPGAGEFRVQGEVTCVKVVGNRATIKYRFARTRGPGAPPAGWGVQVFVEDNGPPGAGTPDGNATDAPLPPEIFDPTADQCELPRGPYNPVDSGNYVVRDGDAVGAGL